MKRMKRTLILGYSIFWGSGLGAWAAAQREPAGHPCKFDIKSMVVQAKSSNYDPKVDKEVISVEALGDVFVEEPPSTVNVVVQYKTRNCREPLTVSLQVFPKIGTRAVNFVDNPNADADLKKAQDKAVYAKEQGKRLFATQKLHKLPEEGTLMFENVAVQKLLELAGNDKFVHAVRFELIVQEENVVVGEKERVIQQILSE